MVRRLLGPFAWRPRLTSGIAVGIVTFFCLAMLAGGLDWISRGILGWDVTCLWFITLVLLEMRGQEGEQIKAFVAAQDEGQGLILGVVLLASVASICAVGVDLSFAKADAGFAKALRVGSAIGTVALSWLMVHIVFALHYAHEFYAPDRATPADDIRGGLEFPGHEPPDYWDFLHFSIVIGVASQTADIAFTSKSLRRIGTVHGIVSFVFNTVVLALTINVAASLFG